jgi:GYF domain 2
VQSLFCDVPIHDLPRCGVKPMNQEDSAQSVWYLSRGGKQFGPISDPELHRLAELRSLRADDLLSQPGFESWRAANTFPGLIPTPTPEVQAALKRERPLGIVLISIYFAVGAVGCFIQGVIDALLAGLGTYFLIAALVYVLLSCLSLATA